jgi:hypothetical protein
VAGADPVGEHRRPQPPSAAAGAHPLRSPRPESRSCRGAGVPPSRQDGDHGFKSRQDRHARLAQRESIRSTGGRPEVQHLHRVPSSSSETEIMTDYESVVGGSSPPGSARPVSLTGKHCAHTAGTDVQLIHWLLSAIPKRTRGLGVIQVEAGSSPVALPKPGYSSGQRERLCKASPSASQVRILDPVRMPSWCRG